MSVLGFDCDWYDPVSGLLQTLYLKFFLEDNTVELLNDKGAFLKRIYYPELKASDLFLGNTVNVYNRLLTIKKCANKATTDFMEAREVRFLMAVKKDDLDQFAKLMITAKESGLTLGRVITLAKPYSSRLLSASAGDCALEVVGIHSTDKQKFLSAINCPSMSSVSAALASAAEVNDFFDRYRSSVFSGESCTLCLIKPHMIMDEMAGEVLSEIIRAGYHVKAISSIHLTLPMAEEMFEVYRGVFLDYTNMVAHMCTTPVLAIMITGSEDIVTDFREFVGPADPRLAKLLRPHSLRALFGVNNVKNGVHCTDLPEDGEMECRFFFETLAGL